MDRFRYGSKIRGGEEPPAAGNDKRPAESWHLHSQRLFGGGQIPNEVSFVTGENPYFNYYHIYSINDSLSKIWLHFYDMFKRFYRFLMVPQLAASKTMVVISIAIIGVEIFVRFIKYTHLLSSH
jgi:hypothetical protein